MSDYPQGVLPPSAGYGWPTLDIEIPLLLLLHNRALAPGNQYKLGGKVNPDADSSEVRAAYVDCSGYVRWLLHRATDGQFEPLDGSFIQHDRVKEIGFKKSSVANGLLKDDVLRIAFLPPGKIGKIGHVALIYNGKTLESHGGTGPDTRIWNTSSKWMANSTVYVLTPPVNSNK